MLLLRAIKLRASKARVMTFSERRGREREREREEGKKEGRRKGQGRSEVPGIKCAVAHCATVVPASGNLARLMQRAALRANDLTSI